MGDVRIHGLRRTSDRSKLELRIDPTATFDGSD